MYDENLNKFKLNDVVTFIGVLEVPTEPEVNEDMIMTNGDGFAEMPIPNSNTLPHLHVITYREKLVLSTIRHLPLGEVESLETLITD